MKGWRKRKQARIAEVMRNLEKVSQRVFDNFMANAADELPARALELLSSEFQDYVAVRQRYFEEVGGDFQIKELYGRIPNNIWVWLEPKLMMEVLAAHGRGQHLSPEELEELDLKISELERRSEEKPNLM